MRIIYIYFLYECVRIMMANYIMCLTISLSKSSSWTSVHLYITIINKAKNFRVISLFTLRQLPSRSLYICLFVCLPHNQRLCEVVLCSPAIFCHNLWYWYIRCCHSHSVHILSNSNHLPLTYKMSIPFFRSSIQLQFLFPFRRNVSHHLDSIDGNGKYEILPQYNASDREENRNVVALSRLLSDGYT